jgi:hypothetical protein
MRHDTRSYDALQKNDPVTRKKEMSTASKPKGNLNTGPQATTTQAAETGEAPVANAAHDEDVRRRAYEIYLERGEQAGHELDDWLQAERELELEHGVPWHAQAS